MTAELASSSASTSHIKHYRPYFSPADVEKLSARQRGKLSVSREEKGRQQACGYIDAVGVRCGFPRRTIATAQTLYMRFHLFFPYRDFVYTEVAISALYVASKLHDTLKKPREIILASYAVRFPHLIKKGSLDQSSLDPRLLEDERAKVHSVERLILEAMCFKLTVKGGGASEFSSIVKIGKVMGLSKDLCKAAWRVAVDCYRTQAPLSYPSHVITLASIYTASLLLLEGAAYKSEGRSNLDEVERARAAEVVGTLSKEGTWESDYSAKARHVDEVAHLLLDLYMTILSLGPMDQSNPSPRSPIDTPSLSSSLSSVAGTSATASYAGIAFSLPAYWTSQTLTELKIHLREARPVTTDTSNLSGWGTEEIEQGDENLDREGMGVNDGTIRFLWE